MRPAPICAAVLALALAACQPVRPDAPPAPAPAATAGADDNLNAVLWVQRSAEYRALAAQTYRAAAAQLDTALAEGGWDAPAPEGREGGGRGLRPAAGLDIDATVVDSAPDQARLVRAGGGYSDPSWDAWVEERKARALPGVV